RLHFGKPALQHYPAAHQLNTVMPLAETAKRDLAGQSKGARHLGKRKAAWQQGAAQRVRRLPQLDVAEPRDLRSERVDRVGDTGKAGSSLRPQIRAELTVQLREHAVEAGYLRLGALDIGTDGDVPVLRQARRGECAKHRAATAAIGAGGDRAAG